MEWCNAAGLLPNVEKVAIMIPFTKKRKIKRMHSMKLDGNIVRQEHAVKYLEMMLDSKRLYVINSINTPTELPINT